MAFKTVEFFISFPKVKYLDLCVLTSCQKPVSIHRIPANLVDLVVVSCQRMYALTTGSRVPNLDIVVFATSQNEALLGMPVTAPYVRPVVGEAKLLLTGREVEHFGCAVI